MTRMLVWNNVGECIDEGFNLRVVGTKAHTLEEKAKMTLQDQPRGLQGKRDESNDGRHSLASCCPEDLSVACRSPSGELTHAPTDPRAL